MLERVFGPILVPARRGFTPDEILEFYHCDTKKITTTTNTKINRPQKGHQNELSLFQFTRTARSQDPVTPVPPQERTEFSSVDKNNNPRRNKTNDRNQQAQARKEPRPSSQVIDSHPRKPKADRDKHHFVLVLEHKRPEAKAFVLLVDCCHGLRLGEKYHS